MALLMELATADDLVVLKRIVQAHELEPVVDWGQFAAASHFPVPALLRSCVLNDELYILKCYSYYFVSVYFTFRILLFLHHNIRII
jgi:hypothetical protein